MMKMQRLALVLFVAALSACASKAKIADPPVIESAAPAAAATPISADAAQTAAPVSADTAQAAVTATEHIATAAQTPAEKNAVAGAPNKPEDVNTPAEDNKSAPAPAPDEAKDLSVKLVPQKKSKGIAAKQSLIWLQHGNKRFVKGFLRKDGQSRKRHRALGLKPTSAAIVLSCSDSRVPPEIVFDQKLGELFVIRTAGEALDPNVIASIEYGLVHLGSKLIVVMGHTYCGAVNAAIKTMGGEDAGSTSLNHLLADLRPRIKQSLAKGKPTEDSARESWANAQGIAEDLKRLSPIIRDAVENDGVEIRPALYYINSGEVKFQ